MNPLVNLVTGDFPYGMETVCFFMAIQGAMVVRNGINRTKSMPWFHAFACSTFGGYAGAVFANIFFGRPTAMFSNDVFFGACIVGYAVVNWLPLDLGYHFFNTFLGGVLHSVFAQIFRVGGVVSFSDAAYNAFKETPSKYYPVPVFGPILFPTILGCMGGFFWGGFDGFLGGGMPWPFQQGISCATFYHFYTHDAEGYIGVTLRSLLKPVAIQIMLMMGADEKESQDDKLFATFVVGFFMASMGVLQMPQLLGPKFTPFNSMQSVLMGMVGGKKKKVSSKPPQGNKKNKKKNQ